MTQLVKADPKLIVLQLDELLTKALGEIK